MPDALKVGARPTEQAGAPKTPPKGYPTDRGAYGDPTNYRYPLDSEDHVRAAISYFGQPANRADYRAAEAEYVAARILAAAKRYGIDVSPDSFVSGKATMDTAGSGMTEYDRPAGTGTRPGGACEVRPRGAEFCVYRAGDAVPFQCFASRAEAETYAAACDRGTAGKAAGMDLLIGFGDAVKALPEGRIGGYVVRFSDEHTPDLAGEFFTAKTDFGQPFPARLGFYYHHGMDTAGSGMTEYDRPAGTGTRPGGACEVRPRGAEFCVYRAGDAVPFQCFASRAEAETYAAACDRGTAGKAAGMDLLIGFGDAVKALPEGRIGGYVVRFSDEHTPDLAGEFFTAKTDFGQPFPARLGFYYHHGMDETVGKRRLAYADVKMDEQGIWFQTQLDLADAYQAKIWQLAEAGKLGASSGAVKHLVERQRVGAADWLKSWPVGEVSATPTPCEPRTSAAALKAWLDEAPSFADLAAGLPPELKGLSLAENTEQWLDRGADLVAQLRRLGAAEAKAGRPQFSAARVERMRRMHETLSELLRECGGMPPEAEPATGMGATAGDGPAEESQFLATLARLNGVLVDAPTAAVAAGG